MMKFLLRNSLAKWRSSVVMFVGFLAFTLIIVSSQAAEAATATVTTNHWKSGASEGYSLNFKVLNANANPPLNLREATLTSGPGISDPVSLILNDFGDFTASIPFSTRPQVNSQYTIAVAYTDGTASEVLTTTVTAVLDSFATPTAPLGALTLIPGSFSWTPPATLPTDFSGYKVLLTTGGAVQWESTPTVGNQINYSFITPGTLYDWSISVVDVNGNSAETLGASFMAKAKITGRVTNLAGEGLPNVIVTVYNSSNAVTTSQMTQADGTYMTGWTMATTGNYKVSFEYPNYPALFYNNKFTIDLANSLTITNAAVTNNINAVIGAWGVLSGKVTNSSGGGLSGIKVSVCDLNGNIIATIPEFVTTTGGLYSISMIPAGSYKIKFSGTGYVDVWYRLGTSTNTTGNLARANTATITAGGTTTLSDAAMYSPQISGKVTNMPGQNIQGIWVEVLDPITYNNIASSYGTQTLADGSYVIGGIPAGNYIVSFNKLGRNTIYAEQYYNLKAEPELATPIAFSTTVKPNINAVLGTILPTITAFSVPATSTTLLVSGISVAATQLDGIAGYLLTESPVKPSPYAAGWSATAPTTYTFASGGTKTLYAWAKDAIGTVSAPASATTTITLPSFTLTLTFAGTGDGSVNGGMSCIKGESCTPVTFSANSIVTLIPTADSNSLFGGWSGACTGVNNCIVTMTSAKTVTATFTIVPPVKMNGTYYPTLQAAYDVAPNGAVIMMKDGVFVGTLTANRNNISVTIEGGYNTGYTTNSSETTIQGQVLLRAGTVRMEKINAMD